MNEWLSLPHFMRPDALWLLLALPLLPAWWWWRRRARGDVWDGVIDAHLRPHVLVGAGAQQRAGMPWALLLGLALAVLALAGPSWRQTPQPLWQEGRALAVALDLSSASIARDLPPDRLLQARAKLRQLLAERGDAPVALLAFADDAFTVAPLTDDAANVALFIDALAPQIMPLDGHDAARAIELAQRLLRQGGAANGDILLLTDHADDAATAAARAAAAAGFRVSAIGLGTPAGAEVQDGAGRSRQARLDAASLRTLVTAGGGRYATLTADVGDLRAVGVLDAQGASASAASGAQGLAWQDQGYWLLLPLALLALWSFRRHAGAGLLPALLLACGLGLAPQARAEQGVHQDGWWLRADQRAHRVMREGERAYRAGDYARAAELYARLPGADAQYNLGNALAKGGQLAQAIEAYDRALQLQPQMEDARANRAAVERAMQRPPASGGEEGQDDRQQGGQDGQGQQGQQQTDGNQGQAQDSSAAEQGDAQSGGEPQHGADSPADRDRSTQPPSAADGEPPPADAEADARQRAAEQAQREAMARALQDAGQAEQGSEAAAATAADAQSRSEEQRMVDAWLRRVPDTPGDWLRQKFWIEHQRRLRGEDD
ncbi:VWA domain-containing protein [Luteimonas sp. e5]